MNDFHQSFEHFLLSLKAGIYDVAESAISLCFKADSKRTLQEIYKQDFLFNPEFLQLDFSSSSIPETYRLLFKIIETNTLAIEEASKPVKLLSKHEILQAAAYIFERDNASQKYNERLNKQYPGILPEALRQTSY